MPIEINHAQGYIEVTEVADPGVSGSNATRIFADTSDSKIKASEDGATAADLVGGGTGSDTVYVAQTTITPAEIRDLHNTVVTIAPGVPGKIIVPLAVTTTRNSGGTISFDEAAADGDLSYRYNGSGGQEWARNEGDNLIDGLGVVERINTTYNAFNAVITMNIGGAAGLPLVLWNNGAAFTGATADSTFSTHVWYVLLDPDYSG